MELEHMLHIGTDKMIPRYAYHKPLIVRFPDRCEWQEGFQLDTKKGTDAGVYRWGLKKGHSFSLGLYSIVFWVEIYIIKASVVENIKKGWAIQEHVYSF
jgi:hypothetical protein